MRLRAKQKLSNHFTRVIFRKKLLSTVEYIFQALFLEGKNSDITVCALGEEFNLHKVYLCQSPYFASMFGGSWLETTQKYITIDIVDPLINIHCKFINNLVN